MIYHVITPPKILNDDSLIIPLIEISHREKNGEKLVMRKRLIWAGAVLP